MEITWLGHSCFRLRSRETTIITDPYDHSLGYSLGRPTGQIVTVSHQHPGHNNVAAVGGEPKVVDGPGEYELSNVFITGIATYHDSQNGKQHGKNTVYVIEMEGLSICHLGDLGSVPSAEQIEALEPVDVLFVPVGGITTLDASSAAETISQLGPKVCIPMHYHTEALKRELEPLDRFLKEMGLVTVTPQPRLTVTKATLPAEPQVAVLDYRH